MSRGIRELYADLAARHADTGLLLAELRQILDVTAAPPAPGPYAWDDALTRRGVKVEQAADPEYTLVHAAYYEGAAAQGRHAIYVDVVDENGVRMVGAPVRFYWPDGRDFAEVEAKPGEPWGAAFPLFAAGHAYSMEFGNWVIAGMGLGTIAEPHVGHHVAYEFRFQKRREAFG